MRATNKPQSDSMITPTKELCKAADLSRVLLSLACASRVRGSLSHVRFSCSLSRVDLSLNVLLRLSSLSRLRPRINSWTSSIVLNADTAVPLHPFAVIRAEAFAMTWLTIGFDSFCRYLALRSTRSSLMLSLNKEPLLEKLPSIKWLAVHKPSNLRKKKRSNAGNCSARSS